MLTILPLTQDQSSSLSRLGASTGEHVGPGTYGATASLAPSWGESPWSDTWEGEDVLSAKTRSAKERFQGLVARPGMHTWKNKSHTPGPGTYALRHDMDRAPVDRPKTGPEGMSVSAFRSRVHRIGPWQCPGASFVASTVLENPGPGNYAVARDMDLRAERPRPEPDSKPPPLGVSESAPTIPAARDPATLRFSGRPDQSVGPGDYEVDGGGIGHASRRTNFHKSRSERDLLKQTGNADMVKNPGPGTYNVRTRLNKGVSGPFKSKSEQSMSLIMKDNVPGPGTYAVDKSPRELSPSSKEKVKPFPGLRSTTERPGTHRLMEQPFTDSDSFRMSLGPGHYPIAGMGPSGSHRRSRSVSGVLGTTFHAVHTPHQMKALADSDGAPVCGFKASKVRDCNRPMLKDAGGPGQYNHHEAMGQCFASTLKEKKKIGKNGAFGSQADRFFGSAASPASVGMPGPDSYTLPAKSSVPNPSGFKDTSERTSWASSSGPGPGTYEAFNSVDYKSKYKKNRTEHLCFGAGGVRKTFTDDASGSAVPGPGHYAPGRMHAPRVVGAAVSSEAKGLPVGQAGGLGPGHYEVSGSMLRDTFNATYPAAAKRMQGKPFTLDAPTGGGAGGGLAGARKRMSMVKGYAEEGLPYSVNVTALTRGKEAPLQLPATQPQQVQQQQLHQNEAIVDAAPAVIQPEPQQPRASLVPPDGGQQQSEALDLQEADLLEQGVEEPQPDQGEPADDVAPVEDPQVEIEHGGNEDARSDAFVGDVTAVISDDGLPLLDAELEVVAS